MRLRTKMRIKFYLNLVAIISLTIAVGVFFEYLAWLSWRMKYGLANVTYELFAVMAAILFIMVLTDIFLFFRLILRRQYW